MHKSNTSIVSEDSLDTANSSQKILQQSVEQLRWELSYQQKQLKDKQLHAPFNGIVTYVGPEQNEFVNLGSTVLVVSSAALEVEVKIPGAIADTLRVNDAVGVRLSLSEIKTLSGRVMAIAPPTYGLERLSTVVIDVSDNSHTAQQGMAGEVVIKRAAVPVLAVPIEAVLAPNNKHQELFVVKAGLAKTVAVKVARFMGNQVVVEGDLQPGDQVIVTGNTTLLDGDRVEFSIEHH